jgi:hypothetical protein
MTVRSLRNREEMLQVIFQYIEVYYNLTRRLSAVGLLSPIQFVQLREIATQQRIKSPDSLPMMANKIEKNQRLFSQLAALWHLSCALGAQGPDQSAYPTGYRI